MADWNGVAWCTQHQCHPTTCFEIHHPESVRASGGESAKQMQKRIKKLHKAKQKENAK